MKQILQILLLVFCLSFSSAPDLQSFYSYAPQVSTKSPKNIILMIGDGMGLGQISAGISSRLAPLAFSKFPIVGFQKTSAYNDLITDSAAAATAMACGVKTFRNAIGVDKDTIAVQSILEEAESRNLATGIVVTSTITHATPASFYAHQPLRNFYEDIALDMLDTEIDFLVGGGKSYYYNYRNDGRNLLDELKNKGYDIFDITQKSISKIKIDPDRNFLYFTAEKQPPSYVEGRNYLPLATKKSIPFLKQRSEEGFFLLVEGSQIDWAGHANEGASMLSELMDFNKTIESVLQFAQADGETLVIVTADHETGGLAINEKSKKKKVKMDFTTNNHTATLVPVFAYGPKAELFNGIYDNTEIYKKMRAAFGWQTKSGETTSINTK